MSTPDPVQATKRASYLVVNQKVADIPVWFSHFSAATETRRKAGGGDPLVLIEDESQGQVLVIVPFESAESAIAWRIRMGATQQIAAAGVSTDTVQVRVLQSLTS